MCKDHAEVHVDVVWAGGVCQEVARKRAILERGAICLKPPTLSHTVPTL